MQRGGVDPGVMPALGGEDGAGDGEDGGRGDERAGAAEVGGGADALEGGGEGGEGPRVGDGAASGNDGVRIRFGIVMNRRSFCSQGVIALRDGVVAERTRERGDVRRLVLPDLREAAAGERGEARGREGGLVELAEERRVEGVLEVLERERELEDLGDGGRRAVVVALEEADGRGGRGEHRGGGDGERDEEREERGLHFSKVKMMEAEGRLGSKDALAAQTRSSKDFIHAPAILLR